MFLYEYLACALYALSQRSARCFFPLHGEVKDKDNRVERNSAETLHTDLSLFYAFRSAFSCGRKLERCGRP